MDVAWIGLGSMGLPSAKMVAAAGHKVRGYDINPPAPGTADGITLAASPREAAAGCELLCIAVFSDAQVEETLLGPNGVLQDLKPGAVVAVFTTGSIESIQAIAARAPVGISILDTCFSRQRADIATGKMTLLAGGDAAAIERGRPAFDAFANRIVHVGPVGSGRAIKLVNNILYAAHLQIAAAGLRLAEGLGLDPRATADALSKCSGASEVLVGCAEQDIAVLLEMSHRYMEKDVSAAASVAEEKGIPLGVLADATRVYRQD